MTTEELYLLQCRNGCRVLADTLTGNLKEMSREDLERNAELMAYRFKGMDEYIMKKGLLPEDWKQSHKQSMKYEGS